jgi:hypothetical protein
MKGKKVRIRYIEVAVTLLSYPGNVSVPRKALTSAQRQHWALARTACKKTSMLWV